MQQKNNSRRIRICAVCFALLIMLIAAATYYFACRGTEYRILDDAEIQQMSARSEYSTEAQRTLAESALMLVGKVNYFWGGKSYTVGMTAGANLPKSQAPVIPQAEQPSLTDWTAPDLCFGVIFNWARKKPKRLKKSASAHGISGINPLKLKKAMFGLAILRSSTNTPEATETMSESVSAF
mgnify:CR=1 FL=1